MHIPIELLNPVVAKKPFPHFHKSCAISDAFAEQLLTWLETNAPWRLKVASFYEQYEFSLFDVALPSDLQALCHGDTLSYLRREIGSAFQTELTETVDVTAHQLIPNQRIRIHNDYIPGRETHRLLIQLNRDWSDECGGILLLFHRSEPEAVSRLIRPISRSALAFAISPESHHAVSTVHKGQRFTLVYSFYERDPVKAEELSK